MGDQIVGLNIGGIVYQTTKNTLCGFDTTGNFFTALLCERLPALKDKKGNFFIDRDGMYFQPLLEYLRTGELHIPPSMNHHCVFREAEFYQIEIPTVNDYLRDPIVPYLQSLKDEAEYLKHRSTIDLLFTTIMSDFTEQARMGNSTLISRAFCVDGDSAEGIFKRANSRQAMNQFKPKVLFEMKVKEHCALSNEAAFTMLDSLELREVFLRYCTNKGLDNLKVEPWQISLGVRYHLTDVWQPHWRELRHLWLHCSLAIERT